MPKDPNASLGMLLNFLSQNRQENSPFSFPTPNRVPFNLPALRPSSLQIPSIPAPPVFDRRGSQPQPIPSLSTEIPQAPQIQTQPIGLPQHDGGALKSILGNLVSGYLTNKLDTYQKKEALKDAAAETKTAFGTLLDDLHDSTKDEGTKNLFGAASKAIKSSNPDAVEWGMAVGKQASKSFIPPALQKELENPDTRQFLETKERTKNLPSGTTLNAQGELEFRPMAEGGNFNDILRQRSVDSRMIISPAQESTIANQKEQGLREQRKENLAEKRFEESRTKDIPPAHKMVYIKNQTSINQIDDAIKAVKKRPQSFGLTKIGGDLVNQYSDPEGVTARGKVAQIGRINLHDLSGAAVTAAEAPGFKPFIPAISDKSDSIIDKLNVMKDRVKGTNNEIEEMYKSGYRSLPGQIKTESSTGPSKVEIDREPHPEMPGHFIIKYKDGAYGVE